MRTLLVVAALSLAPAGCQHFQRANEAVMEDTNGSALGRFVRALPRLALNPMDPEVLGQAVGLIVTYGLALFGVKAAKKRFRKKT